MNVCIGNKPLLSLVVCSTLHVMGALWQPLLRQAQLHSSLSKTHRQNQPFFLLLPYCFYTSLKWCILKIPGATLLIVVYL